MAFLGTLIQYVVIFIVLAAIGVGGVFFGKFLRSKKNEKAAAEASEE